MFWEEGMNRKGDSPFLVSLYISISLPEEYCMLITYFKMKLFPSVLLNNNIYTRCSIIVIHEGRGLHAFPVVC